MDEVIAGILVGEKPLLHVEEHLLAHWVIDALAFGPYFSRVGE